MKFRVVRRVALRRTYEFTEIHAETKNMSGAREALRSLEKLADFAREIELTSINFAHRRSKS